MQSGDRWRSIAAVAVVHLGLAYALLYGLSVQVQQSTAAVTHLIAIHLLPPPPLVAVEPQKHVAAASSAPAAVHDNPGSSTGPSTVRAANPVAPVVASAPTASPGGTSGHGTLTGSGSGGGTGGQGTGAGDGDGGSDLELLSGEFRSSDYPRSVRPGIGGKAEFHFMVGVNGRVTDCGITRSTGNATLDATTCRVVVKRFRFRPATDANGRPISSVGEGDVDWTDVSQRD